MEAFMLLVLAVLIGKTWALYRIAVMTKETRR